MAATGSVRDRTAGRTIDIGAAQGGSYNVPLALASALDELAGSVDVGELRVSLGMTQERLAEWLGVDPRTVRRWEAEGAPFFVRLFFVALRGFAA